MSITCGRLASTDDSSSIVIKNIPKSQSNCASHIFHHCASSRFSFATLVAAIESPRAISPLGLIGLAHKTLTGREKISLPRHPKPWRAKAYVEACRGYRKSAKSGQAWPLLQDSRVAQCYPHTRLVAIQSTPFAVVDATHAFAIDLLVRWAIRFLHLDSQRVWPLRTIAAGGLRFHSTPRPWTSLQLESRTLCIRNPQEKVVAQDNFFTGRFWVVPFHSMNSRSYTGSRTRRKGQLMTSRQLLNRLCRHAPELPPDAFQRFQTHSLSSL